MMVLVIWLHWIKLPEEPFGQQIALRGEVGAHQPSLQLQANSRLLLALQVQSMVMLPMTANCCGVLRMSVATLARHPSILAMADFWLVHLQVVRVKMQIRRKSPIF